MSDRITFDANSNIIRVVLLDSASTTGGRKTGLTKDSASLIISTAADVEATATPYTQVAGNIEDIAALGTYAAPTAGKCRFKEFDATNHPGWYEIQIADARFSIVNAKKLGLSIHGASGLAQFDGILDLPRVNLDDSVRAGLTALPNAAADAAGGLPISDAGALDLDANFAAMALESTLGSLSTSVGTLQIDLTAGFAAGALESTLGSLVTSVGTLQTDLTAGFGAAALETTLGGLVTSVGTLQTDLTAGFSAGALEATLGALSTSVGTLQADLTAGFGAAALEATLGGLVTTVGTNGAGLTAITPFPIATTATGAVAVNWAQVEGQDTNVYLEATTIYHVESVEDVDYVTEVGILISNDDKNGYTLDGIPDVNVEEWRGSTPNVLIAGRVDADVGAIGEVDANVVKISGDATAADNLELAADGTGYNLGSGLVVAASVTGAVGSVTGSVGSMADAGASLTAIGDTRIANLDATVSSRSTYAGGAVASVSGGVGGSVTGSVGSVAGNVSGSVGSMADAGASLTAIGDTRLNNLDAPISGLATDISTVLTEIAKLQVLPRGIACANFPVKMILTGTDTPATGKTVTGQISKDGAAFGAMTNAVGEIGNGAYKVNVTATEMTADVVILVFSATGCAQRMYSVKTQS